MRKHILLGLILINYGSFAQEKGVELGLFTDYHVSDLILDLQDVRYVSWENQGTATLNLGLQKSIWLRIKSSNIPSGTEIISLRNSMLDAVDFYAVDSAFNKISSKASLDSANIHDSRLPFLVHYFELPEINNKYEILIRVTTNKYLVLPLYANTYQEELKEWNKREFFAGLYFGFVALMIIYNLYLSYSLADTTYLSYILYILTVAAAQGLLEGTSYKYLYPSNSFLAEFDVFIFVPLSVLGSSLFVVHFLKLYKHSIFLIILFTLLCGSALANLFYGLTTPEIEVSFWLDINSFLGTILVFIAAFYALFKGEKQAYFFIIAWSAFIAGIAIFMLKDFSILPYSTLTFYAMPMGSVLEMTLISLALANRIKILKQESDVYNLERAGYYSKRNLDLQRNRELRKKLEEAEYKTIISMLNPHFVFNVMNGVSNILQKGEDDHASVILGNFASLVRKSIITNSEPLVPLAEEQVNLDMLIDIESMKLDYFIDLVYEIEKGVDPLTTAIPSGVLAPMIDNAVNHGFVRMKTNDGLIRIRFRKVHQTLEIDIIDNGIGLVAAREWNLINKPNHQSMGSYLIMKKMDITYGSHKCTFKRKQNEGERGTTVTISIPFVTLSKKFVAERKISMDED